MSIVKGIIKYIFILICLICAIGVIAIGAMYFFPSINLFGYEFYKGTIQDKFFSAYDLNSSLTGDHIVKVDESIASNFEVLILKTSDFDINLTTFDPASANAPLFTYKFCSNMKGLKSIDNDAPYVNVETLSQELVTGEGTKAILKIEVKEPNGIFWRNDTALHLQIPSNVIDFEQLIIENNSGRVIIGDADTSKIFNVNNTKINSNGGKIIIKNTTINNKLEIDKSSGELYVENDINSQITLNSQIGKYYFENVNSSIDITSSNSDIRFKNVSGNVSLKMDLGLFKAETIDGEFSSLENPNTGNKNECDIKISKILKTLLIHNDSGNIEIGQTSEIFDNSPYSQINIVSNSSDITIKQCFSNNVKISSGRGKITLGKCRGNLSLDTTYGSVYVDYISDEDTIDYAYLAINELASKKLIVETAKNNTGDGAININNIRCATNLKSNGSGNISINYAKIVGTNTVISQRGKIDIVVPDEGQGGYLLKWDTTSTAEIAVFTVYTKVNNSLNYTSEPSVSAENGWQKILNATSTTENKLNVSSFNSINIIDITRL